MEITITQASKTWGIPRARIYEKINSGAMSRLSNGKIDPAEMSRVFGKPRTHGKTHETHEKNISVQEENALIEQKRELENLLRIEREKREQAERRAERAEKQADQLLEQVGNLTETMKLLEAPKSEPKTEKKGFLSRFF